MNPFCCKFAPSPEKGLKDYREKSQLTIILYAVKTNRDSIHRASTKTLSNHDGNPRSWIKFKVDIVIPVVENITKKYHKSFHKRVSDRES